MAIHTLWWCMGTQERRGLDRWFCHQDNTVLNLYVAVDYISCGTLIFRAFCRGHYMLCKIPLLTPLFFIVEPSTTTEFLSQRVGGTSSESDTSPVLYAQNQGWWSNHHHWLVVQTGCDDATIGNASCFQPIVITQSSATLPISNWLWCPTSPPAWTSCDEFSGQQKIIYTNIYTTKIYSLINSNIKNRNPYRSPRRNIGPRWNIPLQIHIKHI